MFAQSVAVSRYRSLLTGRARLKVAVRRLLRGGCTALVCPRCGSDGSIRSMRPATCRISTAASVLTLLLFACAFDNASAQDQTRLTVDRIINFNVGSDSARARLQRLPVARQIVAGRFGIATIDLDNDGQGEILLLAGSPPACTDAGCPLLVLREVSNGVAILLMQRVTGRLAVTKETIAGFRALAEIDAAGNIAVENRPGAGNFGKPLVYAMHSGSQARPDPRIAAPSNTTPPERRTASNTMELAELLRALMTPSGAPDTLGDWTFGAQQGSPIRWETSGIKETSAAAQKDGYPYHRTGIVVITIDGKPTHEVLERSKAPGKWAITLLGPRAGYNKVTISTGNSPELGPLLAGVTSGLQIQHYRCKSQSLGSGNAVYRVQTDGMKPIWVDEQWSCGSAGCGVSLEVGVHEKAGRRDRLHLSRALDCEPRHAIHCGVRRA